MGLGCGKAGLCPNLVQKAIAPGTLCLSFPVCKCTIPYG